MAGKNNLTNTFKTTAMLVKKKELPYKVEIIYFKIGLLFDILYNLARIFA